MTQQQSIEQLPPPATTTVATNAATIETTEAPAAATTEAATAADAPAVTTTTVTAVRRLKSKQRLAAVMRDLASAKERYKLRLQRQQALEQQRFNPPSEDELMEAAILAALHENQMTVEEKEEQKKRQQLVKLRHQQVAAALHKASENFTRLQEFKENPPPQWHLPAQCSSDMATTTRKKNQSSVSISQYHRSSATELMRLAKSIEELKKREEIEAQQQRTQDPVKKRQSPLRSVQIHQSIDDAAFIDDAVYSTVMSKLRNIRTALVTVLQQVISEDNVKEFGDLYLLHTFLRHGDDSSVLRLLKCSELLLKYKIDDLLMRRLKRQSQRRLNAITAEDTTKSQFDDDGEVSPPAYEDLMIDLRYDSSHSRDPSSFDHVTSTLAELIEDQQKQQAVGSLLHSMVRLLEQNDVDVSCFASEESKTNKEGDQLSVPQSIEQALCISFEQMILLPQVFQLLYPDASSEGPQNSCIADTERHFLQAMSKLNDYAAFSREMLATESRSVPYDQRREGVFARIIDQSNCFSVPFALQMIEFGSKILLKPCSILELVAVFDRKQRGFLGVSEFRQLLEVSLGNAIDRRKYFRAIHELNPSSYVSLDSILSFIYSLWKTQLKYLHHQLQSKSVKEELQQKQMLFYELCKESMKFNFPREWRDEFTLHDELSYSTRQMLQEMRLSEIMMIGGFRQHMDMMNHQQCNCQILSCKNSLLSSANRYNTYTLSDFDQSKRDALQDHCIKAGMASVDAVYAHRDAVRDASSKLKNTNQGTKIKESARSILPHEQNVDLKINSSSGRRIKTSDGDYLRVKVVQFVDPPDDIA